MKPYLFPFTYVNMSEMNACRSFFEGLKVFQSSLKHLPETMRPWVDQGILELSMPDPSSCLSFEAALEETDNWARNHRLGAASYLKGYRNKIPFFDATSVSQIRQDIRTAGKETPAEAPREDTILPACIFLQMAQEFDAQNQSILQQMQQQDVMERNLYQELRGDAPLHRPGPSVARDDPLQFMLLDRLTAWSRILLSGGRPQGPFVTIRDSVLSLIQEHLSEREDLILAATLRTIEAGSGTAAKEKQTLWSYCDKLAHTDLARIQDTGLLETYPTESSQTPGMRLYFIPEVSPYDLFARFFDSRMVVPGSDRDAGDVLNTVIGLIEHKTEEISENNHKKS